MAEPPHPGSPRDESWGGCCEVWGVLNVTPDSFSDGGEYLTPERAFTRVRRMLDEGADVIDIGGASSRPPGSLYGAGADDVPEAEEVARVQPVVDAVARELRARVSIDTTRAAVARAALQAGATIVNDVSCATNEALLRVVADADADYVLMHNRGRGEVSGPNTRYDDVVADVTRELAQALERVRACGIEARRVWIDPGFGFAKTAEQSLRLLAHLEALRGLGARVLVGASRKGFIAHAAPLRDGSAPPPRERLGGSVAAVTLAVMGGAHAVRVHDVAASWQAVRFAEAVAGARA